VALVAEPETRQVVGRRWKYAPPLGRMFEALTDERESWLDLLADEISPQVLEATRPDLVIFQPWVDPIIESVAIHISRDEDSGSSLRILATAHKSTLSDEERRWTRYRLGVIFGGALREWVDEPHR
jgi:hypothetical protein